MDDSMMVSNVFSKYTGKYTNSEAIEEDDESNSYMNFDSYLKLMVAQMQNQDFNNPMDDSEVLAQMAQYSMLEGIKNMTQQSAISYATSLVGKIVTVTDGNGYYTGPVESVSVTKGEPWLMIDGVPYRSDTVSDIVSEDAYNKLNDLVGKRVKYKEYNEDGTETEIIKTVRGVVFMNGEGYVVAGSSLVLGSKVTVVEDGEASEGEGEGSEGTEESSSEDDGETVYETGEAQAQEAFGSYEARSQSLIDTFMRELDSVGGVSEASETNGVSSESYTVETVQFNTPDVAAGYFASADRISSTDGDIITDTAMLTDVDYTYGSGSGTVSRDDGSTDSDTDYDGYSDIYGDVNIERNYVQYDTNLQDAERTASGKLKGVTTKKSISESDCVPHRISVEDYPEEAALADELGTRMYDIRYINNHDITSRIKTGEVIGTTSTGKEITEIGYSGVGQLGEVVTFANGTQRVEVLLKNGKSTWLMTSGNFTLDEICNKNAPAGSLTGRLTPEESAIRHYSDLFSDSDRGTINRFENYLRSNGIL